MIQTTLLTLLLIISQLKFNFSYKTDQPQPVIEIESGYIKGRIAQSGNGNDFYAFQEIPYAAPPIGENRYRLPKPPIPWNGTLNTTKNTKICYQAKSRFQHLMITEDCLYINVYTPIIKKGELLPVLVWIHGGAFVNESSVYEYYGPKYIIDYQVIVVTFNYRLGPFGFLATEDGVIPRDLGFQDQIYALKWINRNINRFGGDNRRVTIVGESAGSASVGKHLIHNYDKNNDLFQRAIQQSGSPIGVIGFTNRNLTVIAIEMAQRIDPTFKPNNTIDLLDFLQKVDASDILKHSITELSISKPDSTGNLGNYIKGNFIKVPVLIGFNSEEMLFSRLNLDDDLLLEIDKNPSILIPNSINMSDKKRAKSGELLKKIYTKNAKFIENKSAYIKYNTDTTFVTSICKQTEIGSIQAPHYFYQFSYKGELGGQINLIPLNDTERVVHAEDLHYMWEETNYNSDINKFPESDRLTMNRFLKLWTNFVKYGNPTPEIDSLFDNIIWPATNPETLTYLNFNKTLEIRTHPRQYKEIKSVLEEYMEPPYWYFN